MKAIFQTLVSGVILLNLAIAGESPEAIIRARIAADNEALVEQRTTVDTVRLDRVARNQFLDPKQELKFSSKADAPSGKTVFWYEQPASFWTDALPIGNGRLGAMVFGGIRKELIQLNEDTLWTGEPIKRANPQAPRYLEHARQLLFDGEYEAGQKLIHEKIMGRRLDPGLHTYQTLGNLEFEFAYADAPVSQYQRHLDLDKGIAVTRYRVGNTAYRREVFSSAPSQALVMRFTADKAGALSFGLSLSRERDAEIVSYNDGRIILTGHAGGGIGVEFAAQLKVINEGGTCVVDGKGLRVTGADAVLILLTAATDYWGGDPQKIVQERLVNCNSLTHDELTALHLQDHRRLFRRVELDLGGEDKSQLPTDKRRDALKNGGNDPGLLALYFQYGRYLLIASSRPGTMPANLQGIWEGGYGPPWNADFHLNINLQMNYWPAEVCNLSELHQPMLDFVDALRERGRITARETYNCRGWVAHHTTDAWLFTDVIGLPQYGMWPMGAAWCCQHLWEHYQYSQDLDYLRQQAYPVMKEAAQFILDWLVEDPRTGYLVSGPSTSPENKFITLDWQQYGNLSMGPTMDHMIIHDLLGNCIEAATILGVDPDYRKDLEDTMSRLAPVPIGEDGRIMEWLEPFHEEDPGHRHISHLFGLYPGKQITSTGTPELLEAARKSVEGRLRSGYRGVGWSLAWMTNFYARFHDGDAALDQVSTLVGKSSDNLFNGKFQIDANFGGTAGIAEMLLQSHQGYIELLPALPTAWTEGSVKGLRARGGFEFDIEWSNGNIETVTVKSLLGNECRLRYGGKWRQLSLNRGQAIQLNGDLM